MTNAQAALIAAANLGGPIRATLEIAEEYMDWLDAMEAEKGPLERIADVQEALLAATVQIVPPGSSASPIRWDIEPPGAERNG